MRVIVMANRSNPNSRLAFIRAETKRLGEISLPAYFDKKLLVQPAVGSEVEVMITNILYNKKDDGYLDYDKPRCLFIAQPEERHLKVAYDGFECGSMAQTMSRAVVIDGKSLAQECRITPGLLQMSLITAENVNHRYGDVKEALTPGIGWIEKNPMNGKWRLAGIEDVKYLKW